MLVMKHLQEPVVTNEATFFLLLVEILKDSIHYMSQPTSGFDRVGGWGVGGERETVEAA